MRFATTPKKCNVQTDEIYLSFRSEAIHFPDFSVALELESCLLLSAHACCCCKCMYVVVVFLQGKALRMPTNAAAKSICYSSSTFVQLAVGATTTTPNYNPVHFRVFIYVCVYMYVVRCSFLAFSLYISNNSLAKLGLELLECCKVE